jgi:predicted negative regulator of RcsB-dependent stress response
MQQWDAAQVLIEAAGGVLSGEFAQLRGDLAVHNGDLDGARAAYRKALDEGVDNAELVRMKLVDIGQGADS